MRYQLKVTQPDGSIAYGIHFNHEWHRGWPAPPAGQAYVEDQITGKVDLIDEKLVTELNGSYKSPEQQGVQEYVDSAFKAAQEKSDKLGNRFVKGKLFSVGVGDGSAYYEVVKVNPKTCVVEWRGFCPDRYVDQVLGYGGTRMPRENIERMVVRQETYNSIFGSLD